MPKKEEDTKDFSNLPTLLVDKDGLKHMLGITNDTMFYDLSRAKKLPPPVVFSGVRATKRWRVKDVLKFVEELEIES